jgi:hypothetical protein
VGNNRVHARRRVLKGAFIVLSNKAPKLECTGTDASETGATLKVSTTDGMRRHCRSAWRTNTKIGVRFL